MFRVKIIAMLTLVVLMEMAIVYFLLPPLLEKEFNDRSRQALDVAATSLERMEKLNDFSIVARAEEIAAFPALREAFLFDGYEEPVDYQRHMGVYSKGLLRWKFVFQDRRKSQEGQRNVNSSLLGRAPHTPDLFFVTDEKGVGVAACCEAGQLEWLNEDVAKKHPSILSSSDGKTRKDIWFWKWDESDKGSFYQVGIAPIMHGPQKVLGYVVVGRKISNNEAKGISAAIGHELAYFYLEEGTKSGERVFASTFDTSSDAAISQALDKSTASDWTLRKSLTIDGNDFIGRIRTFDGNATKGSTSGFVVLTNISKDSALIDSINSGIIILGLLILFMLLCTLIIVIRSFVKPFEEIDQGIQEVLAGNKDYVFKVTGNYPFQTGMADSLNLMSAFIQDKPMPDDEAPPESWGELLFGEVTSTAMMRAVNPNDEPPKVTGVPMTSKAPSKSESVDEYQSRLFNEYFKAKEDLGEEVAELTFESFVAKLERHSGRLMKKHKAKEIRFSVVVRENKVVLKPQPIF